MNADKNPVIIFFISLLICVYLRFQIKLCRCLFSFGVFRLGLVLVEHLALEDPHLHADLAVRRLGLGKTVIDVGAQRMQRHATLAVPFGARDLGAVQAAGDHDLYAQRAQPPGIGHRAFHGAAEHDALFQLLGDVFGHELRVQLRLAHFFHRQLHRTAGDLGHLLAQLLDVLALLANDDAGTRGVHGDIDALCRTLDHDRAQRRVLEPQLEVVTQRDVREQVLGIGFGARVPLGGPVAADPHAESDRIDFLAHQLFSFFTALDRFFSSLTTTVMWLVRLRIRTPRPLAREWKRRRVGPPSTWMVATLSSSTSAPSLCSALAMADSSTLRTCPAAFLGLNWSSSRARATGIPRIWSATRRPFCADTRTYFRMAVACMALCRLFRRHFAVARVRIEGPGRREFAELVADHVLGDQQRHMLPSVVHRDRQADEIRRDRRAARPGLDRLLAAFHARLLHLRGEVRINVWSFPN